MKTYSQFLDEALAKYIIKAGARALFRNQALKQKVAKTAVKPAAVAPKKLSFTHVYHGTTKPASQQISKSGWRTDKNVTRQMTGSGVYTTPQKPAAQMYADQRASQRGESPAVRTFAIPTSRYSRAKAQRQARGEWKFEKGGQKFNVVQMHPSAANRYDITNKPESLLQGFQRKELRQRVSTAMKNPRNRSVIRREVRSTRGMGNSLGNVGSPSGTTGRYRVGGTPGYGISNIRLAD